MATVVIRIAGPMLAWPQDSKHNERRTHYAPTYSAIQGILKAAAGVGRGDEPPDWLRNAEFGVRVESAGSPLEDFHTVAPLSNTLPYSWMSDSDIKRIKYRSVTGAGKANVNPIIGNRYYRQDAEYLVMLDDPTGNLARVLLEPRWFLYAGRKSCVLSWPFLLDTMYEADLDQALETFPTAVGQEGESKQAILWRESPRLADRMIKTESLPDEMQDSVAQNYMRKRRWIYRVIPEHTDSWTDVIRGNNVSK